MQFRDRALQAIQLMKSLLLVIITRLNLMNCLIISHMS